MGFEARNCRKCGKVFVYAGVPICSDCLKKEEEQYARVERYLEKHPRAGVREISQATEVPPEVVMDFVRRGLIITLSGTDQDALVCSICGRPISSGRVCPKCRATLDAATGKAPTRTVADDNSGTRMYSIDIISRNKPR